MKLKRVFGLILIAVALLGCLTVIASADNTARATGGFEFTIEPGKMKESSTAMPLDVDDEVTIKASFTPFIGRVDVGLIDENRRSPAAALTLQLRFRRRAIIPLRCGTLEHLMFR